jgi:hypothetical protein
MAELVAEAGWVDAGRQPLPSSRYRDADIDIGTDNWRDDFLFAPIPGFPVT